MDLGGKLVTSQRGDALIAAITTRDNGRLRVAVFRSVDAKSAEYLIGLEQVPHPQYGVCMRENKREYALDCSVGNCYMVMRFCALVGRRESASAAPHICGRTAKIPLITADEHTHLLSNGQDRAAGQDTDPLPMMRLFTPDAHATWLLASLDPADGDTAHGLIDLGIGMPALDTVKLSSWPPSSGRPSRP